MIKKKTVLPLCLIFIFQSFYNPSLHSSAKTGLAAVAIAGISLTGIYGFYRLISSPTTFEPTLDNLNTLVMTPGRQSSKEEKILNIDELVAKIHSGNTPSCAKVAVETQKPSNVNQKIIDVNKIDKQTVAQTNQNKTIFIFSRGYARTNKLGANGPDELLQKGGCAIAGYVQIRDNIINESPCITFDYPDSREHFNFGQKIDFACLETVYNHARKAYPDAHIVLVGDCRGARCILNFAASKPNNLKAIILMSPFTSGRELTDQVAKNYLAWLPGSSTILHNFFKLYFPSYDEKQDNLLDQIHKIPEDLPIFIGHRKGDTLVADEHVYRLIQKLTKTSHTRVHVLIINDASALHSRLTLSQEFQQGVNAFLKQYDLPHHSQLAIVGEKLVSSAL